MLNLVIFGPPGAGKGTQSQNIIDRFGLTHLSTGDLLRSEVAQGTELGLKAKALMDSGQLVPDEIVVGMIESKLKENPETKGFIFDGFPRTIPQAEALDALLAKYNTKIHKVVSLEVEEKELVQRLLSRGATSGRADDQNEALIQRRVVEYQTKTFPLIDFYKGQGKYNPLNGIGEVTEIFDKISAIIQA